MSFETVLLGVYNPPDSPGFSVRPLRQIRAIPVELFKQRGDADVEGRSIPVEGYV